MGSLSILVQRKREKKKKENVWEEEVAGEEGGESRRRWGRRGEVGRWGKVEGRTREVASCGRKRREEVVAG